MSEEHNFQGTREEWEHRVFLNAQQFRVHRVSKIGRKREDLEVETFPEALFWGRRALDDNFDVIIYAVTETGRAVAVPQREWQTKLEDWIREDKPVGKMFEKALNE